MQCGENLVLEKVCAMAVTSENVPEVNPQAIERHWLREVEMVTVFAPSYPLASTPKPIPVDEFGRHIQIILPHNQPGAETTQHAVSATPQWLFNDPAPSLYLLSPPLAFAPFSLPLFSPSLSIRPPLLLPL